MKRRTFIGLSISAAAALAGGTGYLLSDTSNLTRSDVDATGPKPVGPTPLLHADEERMLRLASMAPSGHNTQPWFVCPIEPFHWIVGNDSGRWLTAVDPLQRETMLSLGAFAQSLESAAIAIGYTCQTTVLASSNQDTRVLEVRLSKAVPRPLSTIAQLEGRRTLRTPFLKDALKPDDLAHLLGEEADFVRFLTADSNEGQLINALTIEANRLQAYRDPAQQELANWIRFSSAEARRARDGLTTAGMQIEGIAGWTVRNFYDRQTVMTDDFRQQGLTKVREAVVASAGWLLISSPDDSVAALLDAGRRLQRIWMRARGRNIAIHPMTQILEEPSTHERFRSELGNGGPVQFILRVGYIAEAPMPVSLRRPVLWFLRANGI